MCITRKRSEEIRDQTNVSSRLATATASISSLRGLRSLESWAATFPHAKSGPRPRATSCHLVLALVPLSVTCLKTPKAIKGQIKRSRNSIFLWYMLQSRLLHFHLPASLLARPNLSPMPAGYPGPPFSSNLINLYPRSALIISAAFSATAYTVVWMLPRGSRGNTLASTTLNPLVPYTLSRASTTPPSSLGSIAHELLT